MADSVESDETSMEEFSGSSSICWMAVVFFWLLESLQELATESLSPHSAVSALSSPTSDNLQLSGRSRLFCSTSNLVALRPSLQRCCLKQLPSPEPAKVAAVAKMVSTPTEKAVFIACTWLQTIWKKFDYYNMLWNWAERTFFIRLRLHFHSTDDIRPKW